jgi:hypothetical protein
MTHRTNGTNRTNGTQKAEIRRLKSEVRSIRSFCVRFSLLCVLISPASPLFAAIPLAATPSWSSNTSNDYSTGGGFWDMDTNGYIDFCVGNGNDMAQNYNAVYYNFAGALQTTAGWRSSDNGYFPHIYLGDVDNDGLMDMAVSYLQTPGDHHMRIYRNLGGGLAPAPWWKSKDTSTSFDCCFGDVNNDGYLDLVVGAGDAYANASARLKIYFNHSGTMDTLPGWQSANLVQTDAVRFADLNNDGKLDLIADGKGYVYVYYQHDDTLEHNPSWVDTIGGTIMGLRLAVGDYDNDDWLDLAVVHNGQIGTGNALRIYHNSSGRLAKPAARILLRSNTYSSCVAWGDANNDGYLDLAAGGWWEPAIVFENHGGVLDTTPDWSWSHGNNLVCEAVLWGDTRNRYLAPTDETVTGDGTKKLFYVDHAPFQQFSGVDVDGAPVPLSNYCFDALTGYVSLRNAPPAGSNVVFHYTYSEYPDLGLTNWEPSDHNYVFYNTTPTAVAENPRDGRRMPGLAVSPTLFRDLLQVRADVPERTSAAVRVYSADGRLTAEVAPRIGPGQHLLSWNAGRLNLTEGVYFVKLVCSTGYDLSCKIIRTR